MKKVKQKKSLSFEICNKFEITEVIKRVNVNQRVNFTKMAYIFMINISFFNKTKS